MKNTNYFSTVPARDIELKVQSVNKGGVILCPYVSKRFVVKALNGRYGDTGWKVLRNDAGNMACIVIKDKETGEWLEKGFDVGTASEFEAEKGLLTDAFKRAAALLGIANALATGPQIFVPKSYANIYESAGKAKCYDRFRVLEIEYDDEECISYLKILNESTGRICFEWRDRYTQKPAGASASSQDAQNEQSGTETHEEPQNAVQSLTEPQTTPQQMTPPPADYSEVEYPKKQKNELIEKLKKTLLTEEINPNWLLEKYKYITFEQMTERQINACLNNFEKVKKAWDDDELKLPFA